MIAKLFGALLFLFSATGMAADAVPPGEFAEEIPDKPAVERKFSELDWDGARDYYALLGLERNVALPDLQRRLKALKRSAKGKKEKDDVELLKDILESNFTPFYDWTLPVFDAAKDEDTPTAAQQFAYHKWYFFQYLPKLNLPRYPKLTPEQHRERFMNSLVDATERYSFPTLALVLAHQRMPDSTAEKVHEEVEGLKRDTFPFQRAKWMGRCGVVLALAAVVAWRTGVLGPHGGTTIPETPEAPALQELPSQKATTKPPPEKGVLFKEGQDFGKGLGSVDGP